MNMSNRLSLIRTKFVDTHSENSSIGFRIFDDYDQSYFNMELGQEVPKEPLELLEYAFINGDEKVNEMLQWVVESQNGMYIESEYFPFEEIKHILDPE